MNFKLWLESLSGFAHKDTIKQICTAIKNSKNNEEKSAGFFALADLYEDIGNYKKALLLGLASQNPNKAKWIQTFIDIAANNGQIRIVQNKSIASKPMTGTVYCNLSGRVNGARIFKDDVTHNRYHQDYIDREIRRGNTELIQHNNPIPQQNDYTVHITTTVMPNVAEISANKQMSVYQFANSDISNSIPIPDIDSKKFTIYILADEHDIYLTKPDTGYEQGRQMDHGDIRYYLAKHVNRQRTIDPMYDIFGIDDPAEAIYPHPTVRIITKGLHNIKPFNFIKNEFVDWCKNEMLTQTKNLNIGPDYENETFFNHLINELK